MKKLNGKVCVKLKYFLKELIFLPIIIFIFTIFFERLQSLNNNDYLIISDFFLKRSNYMFDELKLIFTSVILLTLLEMFIYIKVSDNFLVARIIGLLFSLVLVFVGYTFVVNYNYIVVYILRGAGIYFGQLIFVFLKQNVSFKRANALSAFLVIFMTLFFSLYQYI